MRKKTLLILSLAMACASAHAVSFMTLSQGMLDDSIEFTPMIVTGNESPQDASIPLGFMLVGYREEDDLFLTPEI